MNGRVRPRRGLKCAPLYPLIAAPLLAACAPVGPSYEPPASSMPSHYVEQAGLRSAAALSPAESSRQDISAWWMSFHDPQLTSLIERARRGNLDLQAAASRVRQARQYEVAARAQLLPAVALTAGAETGSLMDIGLVPLFLPPPFRPELTLPDQTARVFGASLDASWDIDIFGRTRREIEAAQAGAEEAVWTERDGQLLVAAEVASQYFWLRGAERRIAILQRQIAEQRSQTAMRQADIIVGDAPDIDGERQRIATAAAEAKLVPLTMDRKIRLHGLAVLAGEPPETDLPEFAAHAPRVARFSKPPASLPSELLRRRPDIRAAERKAARASAQLGVAVADLFPRFTLAAGVGPSVGSIERLVGWSASTPSDGAAMTVPIFDGGRISANIAVKTEEQAQALLEYRKTVLAALRDVEDAQARYGAAIRQRDIARDALDAARKVADMTRSLSSVGMANAPGQTEALMGQLEAEDKVAEADTLVSLAMVGIFKALGGGWTAEDSSSTDAADGKPPPDADAAKPVAAAF